MGDDILKKIARLTECDNDDSYADMGRNLVQKHAERYLENDDNDFSSLVRVLTKSVTTDQKGRVSKFTKEMEREPEGIDHGEGLHAQVLYYLFRSHLLHPR